METPGQKTGQPACAGYGSGQFILFFPIGISRIQAKTVMKDGISWWIAKDVCDILKIKNVSDTLSKVLDDDEKGVDIIYTLGGAQNMAIVNEPGLYSLALNSRKPETKTFT